MKKPKDNASVMEVQYYLLGDGQVARLYYNNRANDVARAEVLEDSGNWLACSPQRVTGEGMPIDISEAKEQLRASGMHL